MDQLLTSQPLVASSCADPAGRSLGGSDVLHVWPRTQFLGALLLTAYLGGATATLVHAGTPFWFPVAMGSLMWLCYLVRSPDVRRLTFPTPLPLDRN